LHHLKKDIPILGDFEQGQDLGNGGNLEFFLRGLLKEEL